MADTLSGVMVPPPPIRCWSGVKGKILTVDLPHKLGGKFNRLF